MVGILVKLRLPFGNLNLTLPVVLSIDFAPIRVWSSRCGGSCDPRRSKQPPNPQSTSPFIADHDGPDLRWYINYVFMYNRG